MFKDFLGQELQVGDHVVYPYVRRHSVYLERRTVERIEDGKLYLNDSKGQHIRYVSNLIKIRPGQ